MGILSCENFTALLRDESEVEDAFLATYEFSAELFSELI